ncbi:MAG TPA: PQQ-binding-like beta-propeller repeat protein, partial [Actinotalea sp.]
LAEIPGILPSLAEPMEVRWEAQGGVSATTTTGVLVLADFMTATTRGLEAATGRTIWSRPARSQEYCGASSIAIGSEEAGAASGTVDTLLLCAPSATLGDDGTLTFGPLSVDLVDPRDGRVVHTLTTSGASLSTVQTPAGIGLLTLTEDMHVRLSVWNGSTGEPVSDATSAEVVTLDPAYGGALSWNQDGDRIELLTEPGITFDLATGQEVAGAGVGPAASEGATRTETLPSGQQVTVTLFGDGDALGTSAMTVHLPDGRTVSWTFSFSDASAGHGTVTAAGGTSFPLPGTPMLANVTDGSEPDVVVAHDTAGRSTVGLDRAGRTLWTVAGGGEGYALLRIDGVLVAQFSSEVRAIDVHDGTVLWTARADPSAMSAGFSDGRRVLLLEPGHDRTQQAVVCRDLTDGTELWRLPTPTHIGWLSPTTNGRQVLASTGDKVYSLE